MKYAKGWFGRAFYYCVIAFGKLSGKTVSGSVEYLPFRSLMQFMGLNLCQAEGFLAMVNGKFFYGLKKLKQKGET
jgi:hypothetical protein